MSRVQLALNVADLDASIEFYTKLFQTEPAKIRDGYANFAIADPPLKLVLFTGMGEPGSLNHIGVEVEDVEAVAAMIAHANDLGLRSEDPAKTPRVASPCRTRPGSGPGERLGVLLRQGRRTRPWRTPTTTSPTRWVDDQETELQAVPSTKSTCC